MLFNTKLKDELASVRAANDALTAKLNAFERSTAMIEFTPDGTVVSANENFLATVGYSLDEIRGKHHRMFCDDSLANSAEYLDFWRRLNRGEFVRGQFRRKHKNGGAIWLEASYNPVYDAAGCVSSIVKLAADVTPRVVQDLERNCLVQAINRSMAVIEFNPDGTVMNANDNFLRTMGYQLAEIQGQHHRKFCESAEANSQQYRDFWSGLNRGAFYSGQFKRVTQRGAPIWLEATYNPVFDDSGKLCKVVKFAVDITEKVERQTQESEAALMAYQIAKDTDVSAHAGNTVVENTVTLISRIVGESRQAAEHIQSLSQQSEHISAIVNTIGSIADQTNLLALNAAIEAARAGDQGRGFAVVADEVRQLAARTSASTAEIANVVSTNGDLAKAAVASMEASLQQAEQGAALAREAGDKIREIREQARQVVDAISQLNSTLKSA